MDAEIKDMLIEMKADIKDIKKCQGFQNVHLGRMEERSISAEGDRNKLWEESKLIKKRVNVLSGSNAFLAVIGAAIATFLGWNK